jgi:uncharacterized protein (TIGR03437 family)
MRFLLVGLALVVGLGACHGRPDSPRIDELAPPVAKAGQVVNILGLAFCGQDPADRGSDDVCAKTLDGFVTFGTQQGIERSDAAVTTWTDTQISVQLPAGLTGAMNVVVTVGGRASNPAQIDIQ